MMQKIDELLIKYIKNNISKENAKTLLEMRGKSLHNYDSILLIVSSEAEEEKNSVELGLEKLAKSAIEEGCEFVASMSMHTYVPSFSGMISTTIPGEIRLCHSRGRSYYSGTGLILKKQR